MVNDRQTPTAGLLHEHDGIRQDRVRGDAYWIAGHDAVHGIALEHGVISFLGDGNEPGGRGALDIAVGDQTDQFVALHDGQVTYGVRTQSECGIQKLGVRLHGYERRAHNVSDKTIVYRHKPSRMASWGPSLLRVSRRSVANKRAEPFGARLKTCTDAHSDFCTDFHRSKARSDFGTNYL